MKIKTSELTGARLDWMVAKAYYDDRRIESHDTSSAVQVETQPGSGDRYGIGWYSFRPSTNWAQGGPIIERERMHLYAGPQWTAAIRPGQFVYGPTPLIAAMRCFVSSNLGDEVDVPEKLL